jgi:predicted Ser/Thr protein kinase
MEQLEDMYGMLESYNNIRDARDLNKLSVSNVINDQISSLKDEIINKQKAMIIQFEESRIKKEDIKMRTVKELLDLLEKDQIQKLERTIFQAMQEEKYEVSVLSSAFRKALWYLPSSFVKKQDDKDPSRTLILWN